MDGPVQSCCLGPRWRARRKRRRGRRRSDPSHTPAIAGTWPHRNRCCARPCMRIAVADSRVVDVAPRCASVKRSIAPRQSGYRGSMVSASRCCAPMNVRHADRCLTSFAEELRGNAERSGTPRLFANGITPDFKYDIIPQSCRLARDSWTSPAYDLTPSTPSASSAATSR